MTSSVKILRIVSIFFVSMTAVLGLLAAGPVHAQQGSLQELLNELSEAREQQKQRSEERVNRFIERVNERESMLNEAITARDEARERREQLQEAFDANETEIAEKSEELENRKGDFGEVFGVIREVAGDTRSIMRESLTASQSPGRAEFLGTLSDTKELPSTGEIDRLWRTLLEEMVATGEIARYETEVVEPNGSREEAEVMRIGPFSAFVGGRFLNFTSSTQELSVLPTCWLRRLTPRVAPSSAAWSRSRH